MAAVYRGFMPHHDPLNGDFVLSICEAIDKVLSAVGNVPAQSVSGGVTIFLGQSDLRFDSPVDMRGQYPRLSPLDGFTVTRFHAVPGAFPQTPSVTVSKLAGDDNLAIFTMADSLVLAQELAYGAAIELSTLYDVPKPEQPTENTDVKQEVKNPRKNVIEKLFALLGKTNDVIQFAGFIDSIVKWWS